jgi:hypothetical protein
MKHPREILFERHRHAGPKLDAIRETTLANLATAPAPPAHPDDRAPLVRPSFRELFRSFRWHLAGLSAAWVLAALLNADPAQPEAPSLFTREAPPPRQLLTALRENRRQIAELLESPTTLSEPVPEPPALVPKRRGGIQSTNATA